MWPVFVAWPKTRPQLPCGPYQGDDEDDGKKTFCIIKVLITSMCFALLCVVTLEMEAIDGGGGDREEGHQHLRRRERDIM